MGRIKRAASLLLAVVLALLLPASFCASEPIKTTPTRWSFHLPLPDGVTGAESLAFDRRGQGPYAGVSDGRVLKWAQVLATQAADGVPFHFVNGLDVDQATGDVYFTDSSTTYARRFNTEIMMNADATGRLLKYDARTKQVTVLKADLPYPNGVAVLAQGAQGRQHELLADLPGYPDNVRRDTRGGYWVALNQEKARLDTTAPPMKHLVGVRLGVDGTTVEELTAAKGVTLSDVSEKDGQLWLGSVELDYVGLA
ncbi:unnamed protein product [Miscanthus lutarioriparius]|uniref:Strictosidine synthase conserved region domain-containing protein n=1 Tax=Miscanthus lutarioriparius TaxID=422564 RepID=A0A811SLV7_9POAL|nr:unnamed protein product [Miscanthus lutarioriparius]